MDNKNKLFIKIFLSSIFILIILFGCLDQNTARAGDIPADVVNPYAPMTITPKNPQPGDEVTINIDNKVPSDIFTVNTKYSDPCKGMMNPGQFNYIYNPSANCAPIGLTVLLPFSFTKQDLINGNIKFIYPSGMNPPDIGQPGTYYTYPYTSSMKDSSSFNYVYFGGYYAGLAKQGSYQVIFKIPHDTVLKPSNYSVNMTMGSPKFDYYSYVISQSCSAKYSNPNSPPLYPEYNYYYEMISQKDCRLGLNTSDFKATSTSYFQFTYPTGMRPPDTTCTQCDANQYYQCVSPCNPFIQGDVNIFKPTTQNQANCSGKIEGGAVIGSTLSGGGSNNGLNYINPSTKEIVASFAPFASQTSAPARKPNDGIVPCQLATLQYIEPTRFYAPAELPNGTGQQVKLTVIGKIRLTTIGGGQSYADHSIKRIFGPYTIQSSDLPLPEGTITTTRSCVSSFIYLSLNIKNAQSAILERSSDNKNFSTIKTWTSNIPTSYIDQSPYAGRGIDTQATTFYYKLTVVNNAGVLTYSTVADALNCSTAKVTVNLLANGSHDLSPVNAGESIKLTWTSTNATNCQASNGWSGEKTLNSTDGESFNIIRDTDFSLYCWNYYSNASDLVHIKVNQTNSSSGSDSSSDQSVGLTIKGDINSGRGSVSNITVDPKSVVSASGDITNVSGLTWQIGAYNTGNTINWDLFNKQMNITIARLINEYGVTSTAAKFSGSTWYVNNGSTSNPTDSPPQSYVDQYNVKPEGKVWVIDNGDLVINDSTTVYGVGTILLKNGNLLINKNIDYGSDDKNSLGFIVQNGNIEIGSDVTSLRGAYYAPKGTITFK